LITNLWFSFLEARAGFVEFGIFCYILVLLDEISNLFRFIRGSADLFAAQILHVLDVSPVLKIGVWTIILMHTTKSTFCAGLN